MIVNPMIKEIQKYTIFFILGIFLIFSCNNANSLAKEGLKNLDQGKKITALKYFEEALDSNKKNPIALYGKGKIMTESTLTLSLGQKLLENSIPKLGDEYKVDAILTLARSYARTNLYDKAIKLLEESTSAEPAFPDLYIDLSFYYIQTLEKTKARNILAKGLEANPKAVSLYLELANVDIKHFGNHTSALSSLEKAYKLENENQEIINKMALENYILGNIKGTVEYLEKLKSLQSDSAEKSKIDEWIAQAKAGKWQANP
ncbi:MAG: tetratricopeptide repeat protein [Spirochaetia bacterium]|nr:tetratricopeptide repeat protein [Spirochaetia bacterium]